MGAGDVNSMVKQTLAQLLAMHADQISDQDELYENLGIDSSTVVTLLLDLELACSVEFDMEALQPEHLATVGSLAEYIRELQSAQIEREG
ncbi:acyl carrier protein [Xylanibacillus composti]|uniref:Carrier domain-containing protein n=1 Tax=Xylanibacillus composti TaxID=1572762 RepID=A0A8J4M3A9_9BACL|nr:acyl carrier protein [Xylanibacillus composti]MDT9726717.1 acyl carrier protein [Xylanibacillus composti]GIQ69351.1 hypothetical protein XYCOK13_21750 [Xylanibacillus composti]